MSEAPQGRPSGGFPWVTCAIVGGIGAMVLSIVAVIAVAAVIYLRAKPVAAPTPMPPSATPQPAPRPEPPEPPEAKEAPEPSDEGITADEAVEKVRALPEVGEWLANVTAAGGSPHIDVDSEGPDAYTVHVFEVVAANADMPSHTATMGWYTVDKATGEAKEAMP